MSSEERYQRLKNCDPTFAEYVWSMIQEGDNVDIDFESLTFTIIKASR